MSSKAQQEFGSLYSRRRRASLDDARHEAEALARAATRISGSVNERSSPADQSLAAGKLFELANELRSAEVAYRRAVSENAGLDEAAARLVIVLMKQGHHEEAIQLGNDLFLKDPTKVFKSLVYEGPLSLCSILGDAYRLSGDFAAAAGCYREAAKLEGGTPYAVTQSVVTMALSGQGEGIPDFAASHAEVNLSERVESIVRLSREDDHRLAMIRQIAARANIAAMEAMV